MKKISVIVFALILAVSSASAQKVVVVRPVAPVYYYHPYSWHPYYGLGFNYSWYYGRPVYYHYHLTKMEKQIQDIEDDYSDRIASVRADNSLTRHERRVKIRELRHERDQAIDDLKKNYYKQYEN